MAALRFDGRAFLVTGGGGGIGRGITARLAAEGARVCVVDVDAHAGTDAVAEYGERVKFVRASVASEPAVRKAVASTVKWAGRLDGVVNNAGIARPDIGPIEQVALATWKKFLDTNLTGAFLMAKHATPHLRKVKGAIINVASTRAVQSEPHTEAYAASKGGLVALTHALAISLGPEIRVNCVSPGWVATSAFAPRDRRKPPKLKPKDHAQHPVGRVGTPEDIAGLCAWLLSDEAGFMTGQNLVSDGGMTRKMIYAE